jgi:hypothetical protein
VYGHTRLYTVPESLKKLITGRLVATGLSFYAWKINRDWQKNNQEYLRKLADGAAPAGWMDASHRPSASLS